MVDSASNYERCIDAAGIALANGDRESAEQALRAAIKNLEGLDGSHLQLASALIRLGSLKQEMGDFADAEGLFRKALIIEEAALGPNDLALVPALTGLGASVMLLHGADKAAPYLTRALEISERALGVEHPDLVILLGDLTRMYLKQGAHVHAEPLLLRLLALKRSKGDDHPEVATVLASLAAVRQALGRYDAAEQLWRRVLEIRERTLAPHHFTIATALEHLGETVAARGRTSEALQHFQRALSIRERTIGADHASIRIGRERIADLQLQSAEDLLDPGGATAIPMDRPRLPMSDQFALSVSTLPERPQTPPGGVPMSPLTLEPSLAMPAPARPAPARPAPREAVSEALRPALRQTAPEPPPPAKRPTPGSDAITYLNVLLDLKEEVADGLDLEAPPATESSVRRHAAAAMSFVRQRKMVAALAGLGLLTVPVLAVAVASSAKDSSAWVSQPAFNTNARRDSLSRVAYATDPAGRSAVGGLRDSTPAVAVQSGAQRPRPAVREERPSSETRTADATVPTIPQQALSRLDSVARAIPMAATRPIGGESLSIPLGATMDNAASRATVRARLIGAVPAPTYPDGLLRSGIGGDVRVRFDVDTAGRPVMSTFAVLLSPHSKLSESVRKVVPTMRFEPARTPWPESRRVGDEVEMSFHFSPTVK